MLVYGMHVEVKLGTLISSSSLCHHEAIFLGLCTARLGCKLDDLRTVRTVKFFGWKTRRENNNQHWNPVFLREELNRTKSN